MDPHFDYGPADYNVKHRVVGSFVYDLPFAKSNRLLGGWNISGIVSVQSGADFSVNNARSIVMRTRNLMTGRFTLDPAASTMPSTTT